MFHLFGHWNVLGVCCRSHADSSCFWGDDEAGTSSRWLRFSCLLKEIMDTRAEGEARDRGCLSGRAEKHGRTKTRSLGVEKWWQIATGREEKQESKSRGWCLAVLVWVKHVEFSLKPCETWSTEHQSFVKQTGALVDVSSDWLQRYWRLCYALSIMVQEEWLLLLRTYYVLCMSMRRD